MNHLKKLAKETAIYGVSSIIGRFLNWWLVPYYSFIFIPESFGIVTNIYSYVAFFLVILTFGMETGFFRFASKTDEPEKVYSTSLFFVLLTSLFFVVTTVILKKGISEFLGYGDHPEYILWMVLVLGIDSITSIPFARLRLKNRPIRFAFIKIVNIGANIGFNVFFLSVCPELTELKGFEFINTIYSSEIGIGYVFLSNLIASLITLILLLPEFFEVRLLFEYELFKKMIQYSFPILIIGIAGMINQNIDKILIPFLVPYEQNPMFQLGIYGANYKLAVIMNMFIQSFRYAFEPFFFTKGGKGDDMDVYASVMKYFVIFGLIIFLLITLYIDFLKILIDTRYHQGLKIVPIVMAAEFFLGISFVNSVWYKLKDKTAYGAYIAVFGSFITLILNVLLIPEMGYLGSAISVFICFLLTMVITYFWGMKYFPVPYNLKRIGLYMLTASILFMTSLMVNEMAFYFKYLFNTVLFSLFLLLVFYKEKKELLSIVKFRLKKKRN